MGRRIGTLGLVNYKTHPTNKRYKVFSFYTQAEADLFAKELTERKVWFESDSEDYKDGTVHLFGIINRDFNRAQKANFVVSAKHRKPIIKNKILRITLMIFFLTLVTIAIVGYVKNMNKLAEKTELLENE